MIAGSRLADLSPEQLAQLQARLQEMRGNRAAPARIPRRTGSGPTPLSFSQQRLWFLHQLDPENTAYNLAFPLRVRGPVDVAALERALTGLVRRHETLRTVFRLRDGDPVQAVLPPARQRVPLADLRGLPAAERDAGMRRLFARESTRPFDLERGPLLRVLLVRTDEAEWGLSFVLHHIVSDGSSMGVMVREVSALYAGAAGRSAPVLPELPVQYADFAAWQRERLSGDGLDAQLAWWRERLEGAPALLDLPTDNPRSAASGAAAAVRWLAFPAELGRGLRGLGQREGATLFMVLLAGFQALLARYSGQEDVSVGSPIHGRTRPELEGLIGFFVNTLALRTDLSGDPSFRELVGRARETALGAFGHQDVPFERLVEELAPERSLTHTPLFQVLLGLQTAEKGELRLGGASLAQIPGDGAMAPFDLTLALVESGDELQGTLTFRKALFEPATAERMMLHLRRLLEGAVADPERRLSQLELLHPAERAQVVEEWNATAAEYPQACAHELFAARARREPEAVALVFGGERIAYGELEARANRLANHLRRLGVGPEVRVGLCLERSAEMWVAVLAVLKAGGAYVPLDPEYPADRLALMVEDAGVAVLLARERLVSVLPPGAAVVVRLDADAAEIAREPADDPGVAVHPDNLAYVVYTSGSTGRPKGVALAHRPLVNLLAWQERGWRRTRAAVTLQFATISFDASFHEAFSCWAEGGTLVVVPEELRRDPAGLLDLVEREGVERMFMPAVALQHVAEEADARGIAPACLREVQTAGEALRVTEPIRRWFGALGAPLHNHYGPSETHVVTALALEGDPAGWPLLPSIGGPIANSACYVVDRHLEPVPAGVPGELYLGGVCLARGYLGRPGLTAERFVPDPFSGEPGARMYLSGDRVRWMPAGTLAFMGRFDAQVKIRGFRIEPGEVEAVLEAHPGVRDAVVEARGEGSQRRLVAYVVPAAGAAPAAAELREHVRHGLPEYMVPGALVVLEALPLTPSGKVNRRALPEPDAASGDEYVAPRTATEEILAGIWAETLRRERVGATDNFFELGGHSLLVTRVVSRVRAALGVELPLRALFEAPSVAELARRVEELRGAGQTLLPPVIPVERAGPLPLSFAQERLWFLDRLQPGGAAYNIAATLRLEGALDAAALERALAEMVRRHEALRTVFAEADGSPVQVVAPRAGFALAVEGLSGPDGGEAEARRRASEEAARPFDLAAGPLFRATLLRLGTEEHLLLLAMHHIVSDGWSMDVLQREIVALYAAFREGRESPLPELPVQYADYAVWQRRHLEGGVLEGELAWWKERLAGAPELVELPADRPRPAVQTGRGTYEPVHVPAELLGRLEALGRSEGATLFMVILAALQALLARYGGSEDVVVGSPVAGRGRREVEGLVGFFVNTLVLRSDLSGDPGFREALRRVRAAALGAYEHQEVPFERLVNELRPERSLSHSPLFQVMLTLEAAARPAAELPGLRTRAVETELHVAKFDLSLGLAATPQGLHGGLTYSTDLFDAGTARRVVEHLGRVLEQAAADPDVRLSQVELLGGAERRRVLEEWNRTDAEYPADSPVHRLFEEQAERTPEAVALVHGEVRLTYRELDERADRVARRLLALGVEPETRVGICVERGPEMVAGILGILKAGGAYVPLDPQYPAERLAYMLADAGAPLVLTRERLRDRLPEFAGEVVPLDGDAEHEGGSTPRRGDPGDGASPRASSPENLAYVIYTSGSTGLPKGTEVPHRAIPGFFRGAGYARFGEGAVVLQHSSVSWDALTLELWPALLSGGTCVLYPGQTSEPAVLGEQVRRHGVNTLWLTAAYFNLIVDTCPEILEGVAQVMTGGEAVSVPHVRRALELYPGLRLVNGYGPSETTVFAACHPVPADFDSPAVPVGRPVGDRRVYLLDRYFGPVPLGTAGELCISGPAVARGYLGRPELTAERFVPDPFGEPGARLYRSGDRARWSADGELEFVGRVDFQVKIRGFRVEPGEVEAALRRQEGVADCAVVVREDAPGEKRLVAYWVGGADAETLREGLRRALPEYMVPAAFVALDRLPLTAHGKLDRGALPAPEYASSAERHVAPRTPTEEVLVGIWGEALRVERVGAKDDFFVLGGHSLLATRVVSRVRQVFGVEVPLRALFEGPTVAELAARVEALRRADAPAQPPVAPVERTGPLPLSFAQERLWFLDRLEPGSASYNVPLALRLAGALDAPALERALGEIVRRHEALRTVFAEVDGSPVQVVVASGGFALPVEDLSGLAGAEREEEVRRRTVEDARRPFDLAAGPLFRAGLLRLGAEEHVLLLCMHHIVSDGWSMEVLHREIVALYGAFREGRESPLPELPVQYADFAAWQRRVLGGDALEGELAWWRERLAGAPALLELPTDRPRPAVQTFRGASEPIELPGELLERLQALGRGEGATLFMVLLGAFQVLLSRYSGSPDVVVGSPIAGRTRREVEELIGFFVNTLVLRTELDGDPSFRGALRRVREATLGAYEHQAVPFERLVEELQPERSLSHSPLFQVMFVLQNDERAAGAPAGLEVQGLGARSGTNKFDLTLGMAARPGGLGGALEYGTDLFDPSTIRRMLGHLERVLEQVAADPDARLSELELLGEAERRQVVEEWNDTAAEFPADLCIHHLFEAQAARTPDAVALVHEDERVTYRELDERANRIAHRLRSLGAGPEARVGVCLERGTALVGALLGVLKAGAAYVPLDPAYPAERLAFTLADSAVAVLLTREKLRGLLPVGPAVRVISLDADAAELARESAASPRAAAAPDNLAYLIYTSGSTGVPKGVAIEHRSAVALLSWAAGVYTAEEMSGVLASTSVCFDLSIYELFLPLSLGGRVVLVDDALALPRSAAAGEVRLINTVPSAIAALLRHGAIPAGVRTVNLAGEPLRAELVDALYAGGGIERVYDLYGPSEDTTYSTWTLRRAGGVETIGRPISNTRAYVLDAAMRPVPQGVAGELYLGGRGLARGYLGRPELTADRFVPDAFAGEPGGRLYRTGDRARWRADGTLEYLGRSDAQVKVRGFRIELGEVEAALRRQEGVADCVVVAREDAPGEKRLVAYVAGPADAETLRGQLRRRLPEYMVPAALVVLDRLPLTANGKVDRKALPAPEYGSAEDRHVAPRTPAEEVLAGIWAETLRLERPGVEDDFFALGGHSLLAIRVVSRVREVFGVELPVRALFEAPTVAGLAARVEALRRAEAPVQPPVAPVERTGPLPLSFAQERLWFLDRLEPGSAFYNVPLALRLGGALDAPALERALGEVVRRHEALRTVFAEVDGSPVQVVVPSGGFALPVEDLSGLAGAEREEEVRQRTAEDARRPFDLAAGPLFRAGLLRLGAEEHVLLLCMHHIVGDAWSTGVLAREVSALYGAFREGLESPLPELPVQYADFAAWQRRVLGGDALEGELAWWRERLAGAPALLELPTDHPRPAVQTFRGASEPVDLPGELLERLQALGRGEGATLFMVVLAAFQVLLSRYSGSPDVVVGSPITGRTRREVEGLIGFFLNTLVLRAELDGDGTFRQALRRVREATLGAFEHQAVPFERLVEELQPERSLSHSPLFQVMFVLQNNEHAAGGPAGLEMRGVAAQSGTNKFDLTLGLMAHPGGIGGALEYSTELFERGTVVRMLGHLERVLEQVAADADVRLPELELLGAAERRQVVEGWNATGAEFPDHLCVHELFEARADRAPDAVALVHAGGRATYRELEEQANRLANHLLRLGVGPDARVGLCLERGPAMMAAVLGILKAGGAYVPLDPAYPADRLAYMLEDSGARVLLTQRSLADGLPASEAVVVRLDDDAERVARESAERPRVPVAPDHLCYVIYTSGSTGRPKGVAMHHRPLVNLLAWQERDWRAPAGAVTLQFATISFDASFHEVFSCWGAGGRVVLIAEEMRYDPAALLEVMEREGVERLFMPAVALQQLAEVAEARGLWPSRLREVQTAGEQLRLTGPMRSWLGALGAPLYNHYGPSETHVVTSLALEGDPSAWPLLPSIGVPIANTQCYVVDAALRPVPTGVPGELYLAGASLARGYLGRPDLTAERFVPDPFSAEPGARMYRSGDRVRWLATGEVEFLGRVDAQVKLRGFRIEPGEVEAALEAHARVREAVVEVRGEGAGKQLVAYVVAEEGAALGAAELRAHARARLPEYMVPGAYVQLEALPLTPSGKVARRALPAPDRAAAGDLYVAPRTPTEEVLAAIWEETLRVERVGVQASFFELGGHSLLAIRVVSRVRDAFGVELPVRALFEAPTVGELAARVEEARRAGLPALPPVVPADRTGPLPLSFAQERLWFLDRLEPGSASYNIPAGLWLGGALDAPALERALGEIVRRHEALRTTFPERAGVPVQVVAPFAGFALPVEDLSGLAADEREAEVRRRALDEAARPFDIAAGPLFRAALLRLGAEEHVLLLTLHHIVGDAWSTGVLFREFSALYAAFREGRESPLAPLPVQYADYAVWQREQFRGEALDAQLSWWKERLAGAPELLELPTDRPRPAVQSHRGAYEPIELPAGLRERLQALARSEGATLFMTLLAGFQVLLGKYSGMDDVVVGSPITGRTRREVEELIGFFLNTLVLRADLSGDPAFRETLRRVRRATLGAYEHQELPFERLVEELQPQRSLSHSPLFQVLFVMQDAELAGGGVAGLEMKGLGAESGTSKFDLTLGLMAHPGGIGGTLEYGTDLFDPSTIRRMLGHLERVLEQAAADPDARLSELELLGEAERRRVVEEWNDTAAEFPAHLCIHQLFEAQAARTPDAVALVHEAGSLTYAGLNARANRLAHHLLRLGVGPEARVGVCLDRGPEMLAALLGILKAGAAYVPLDPAYPAERLAFTLADSAVAVLVTQEKLHGLLPVAEGVRRVSVDGMADRIAAESAENPRSGAAADGLAYLIYTSGSTGVPKGVAIEHRSAVALLSWASGVYTDEELSGVLAATSICFDLSVFELFLPLGRGGRVVLVENALALAGSAVAGEVRLINTVPSAIAALLRSGGIPAGATTVNLAGEPLRAELVDALYASGGIRRVYDLYGPSEDTTYSTWTLRAAGGAETIGRPISNTRAYLLDGAMKLVPQGVAGELYLWGRGLARGYLGRPDLTADRFVPDPFGPEAGARLYRTGDKARWRPDGTLEYLGRVDAQVKVRGYRIELGEIEATLRRHARVRECVVLAREDAPGDRRLAAYVVGAADAEELKSHLRGSLPEYMVPGAYVKLDAMPLTPSGKVDRKALPAPEHGAAADRYLAPRTPTEEVLAAIWGETLRVERVGVREGFFELGGHSLLATRVVSRVREAFGVELPLRALFEAPTVGELALRVEEARRAGLPALPPVVPADRAGPLPLSFAQERLWFLHRLQPESPFYNVPMGLRLVGDLDAGALERALGEIVRRHEALRTVFPESGGSPVQEVVPFAGFTLPVEDLSPLGAEERDAGVRRRAGEVAQAPFDLETGPLFRAALLRLDAVEHVLLLCMHHVVTDGWSLGVFFRELAALYPAFREGGGSPLPELAVQYADHAVWQREQLQGEALDGQLAWWRERLAGAPELLELPTDRPRPPVMSFRGAHEPIRVPGELLARLQAVGRSEGATPFMVVLAALQSLLARYGGSEDVVVGTTIAGRTRREVEGLVGLFMNTLVLRTDLSGDPGFRETLRRVRDATLGAYEHQDVPFERLVNEVRPERSLGHSPLFQVIFELHNAEGPGAAGLPGMDVRMLGAEVANAKFDLAFALAPAADGLAGGLTYSTDLFDAGTARRMVEHLERVLRQVAADPGARLAELELIEPAERWLVVEEWNRTAAGFPADRCIHQLFEEQARRTPDATAVVFADERLTFRELDERASRLARHLFRQGVRPEVRVGLCLERSPELMVALLGVMKAGGAYVPVDPAHPAERIGYVLEDSGVAVLLTQERLRGRLPVEEGVEVVCIDAEWERIAAEPAEMPESGVGPENLCYVIYTSGSTGRPKGVAMHHRGVCNYIDWGIRFYGADAGNGAPVFSSMAVDLTITNLLPLFAGRPLRLLPEESPVEALADALRERPGFGLIKITPTHLSLLTPLITPEEAREAARTLVIGADFLSAETTLFMQENAPDVRLMNEYGPTETVVGCSAYVLPGGVHRAGAVPVGGPIQNITFFVLDAHLEPVPVGLPGELYIGGVGVARGYLGRPALSAEKFVPDPFAGGGARMYRTGDRARWMPGGNLLILGRVDNQVKVRGYRVELGEIEAALRRHEQVRECLVTVREDRPGDRRLVAYVVADADAGDPRALRDALRRALPEYMVPDAFVRLDALPQTSTGKLDPRALPLPEYPTAAAAVAPRNELEERVAEAWGSVLGLAEVGVHDNFFDLGGTSLQLYRVYSQLRAIRGDLRLVDLFRYTTVEALAAYLGAEQAEGPDAVARGRSRAEERRAARRPARRG